MCYLRKVQCEYCGKTGVYELIVDEHYDLCPNVPIACPNGCGDNTLPRKELSAHVSVCPLQEVQCQFKQFGCGVVVTRKDLQTHLVSSQNDHLLLTLSTISKMQLELHTYKTETQQLKDELQKSKMEQEQLKQLVSRPSQTPQVNLPPPSSRTLMERHLEAEAERCLSSSFLPLVIKMENYWHQKHCRKPWYSPPFYTDPFGYKLCLCVYANGCCSGEGTHLSVYIHVMAGEFDDQLEWPIVEDITLELQNQLSDDKHWDVDCSFLSSDPHYLTRRVQSGRARRGVGSPTFLPLSNLKRNSPYPNCQYLKNNCLYFSVY